MTRDGGAPKEFELTNLLRSFLGDFKFLGSFLDKRERILRWTLRESRGLPLSTIDLLEFFERGHQISDL